MTTADGPGDRIELRGLRCVGTHGVLVEEQERAQPFEVDLDRRISGVTVVLRKLRPPLAVDIDTVGVRVARLR